MRWLIFSFIYLTLICSCDQISLNPQGDGHVETSIDSTSMARQTTLPVLITNVDQLRLRRYPDIKSEMLTTFDENTPIYFTGEQTDYEETIGNRKGPWKKIRTIEGEFEGWVFGADFFVEEWLSKTKLDSLHDQGKDIRLVNNLSRSEMNQLSGANFDDALRGTRYSGYYEYDKTGSPQILNGYMVLRARQFDTEEKEVMYKKCTVIFKQGMASTELTCIPILK